MPSLRPSLPLSGLAPASPLPLAGNGPVCSRLALLWYCSVLCSVNRPAVPYVRAFHKLILSLSQSLPLPLSLSLALPQFRLLSHLTSLRLPSGHSGLILTLSNAARSSRFSPNLLVSDASIWSTFLLWFAFRHVICGFYIYFSSQLGCSPRFKNFPQTCRWEGFLVFGNFLY